MSNLKFGWAEVDLTPDKKVALAGQFAERISQYVEKPITATAMAVSSEEEQMILVSCDLVAIGYNLLEDIRKNLAEYEELLLLSECHSRSRRYPAIKRWFLEMYPEVVTYGSVEERPKILQIGEKRAS